MRIWNKKTVDVRERVKTFEDACRELGESHPLVKEYRTIVSSIENLISDTINWLQLRIVVAALNEGWKPTFKSREYSFRPEFGLLDKEDYLDYKEARGRDFAYISTENYSIGEKYVAFVYNYANGRDPSCDIADTLCLRSVELAEYCGKQFIDLWANYYLNEFKK